VATTQIPTMPSPARQLDFGTDDMVSVREVIGRLAAVMGSLSEAVEVVVGDTAFTGGVNDGELVRLPDHVANAALGLDSLLDAWDAAFPKTPDDPGLEF
jgi:hypothetical protein